MIYRESKIIDAYAWDMETGIFSGPKKHRTEVGFGLPAGMIAEKPAEIKGKVAIINKDFSGWDYIEDDRGRVFFDKLNGQAVKTTVIGEVVDRRRYTKISPPAISGDQLLIFVDSKQEWLVGFDWYEKPIFDKHQNMSYFTGEFFVPNEHYTNKEPEEHQVGFDLNDVGDWIAPEPEADTSRE